MKGGPSEARTPTRQPARAQRGLGGRVLVAGIGNVFFGDDGFGVEVANQLLAEADPWPDGVRVAEYGIRGLHLALDLLDGCDALVLVDALPMQEAPGTIAVIEIEPDDVPIDVEPGLDVHSMSPAAVLGLLAGLGGTVGRVLVVGCEPAAIDGIGLSDAVLDAVPTAVVAVHDLVSELLVPIAVPVTKKEEHSS